MTEQTTKASQSRYIIGVDVGGTFTDLFFVDQQTGEAFTGKLPSTLENQSIGLIEGILRALPDFSGIDTIVHGTTVGTNALLERKGSQTGLITTEGFEDVLEMRRRDRPETWGLRGDYRPVIQRNLRLGVAERTLASGQIERSWGPETRGTDGKLTEREKRVRKERLSLSASKAASPGSDEALTQIARQRA